MGPEVLSEPNQIYVFLLGLLLFLQGGKSVVVVLAFVVVLMI